MKIVLTRYGSIPNLGTFGQLQAGPKTLFCVEQPWNASPKHPAGVPSKSCVPAGIYSLVPHNSIRHPDVVALVNEKLGVYHYPAPEALRNVCLIHPANWPRQVEGCIAPGVELRYIAGALGVTSSRDAVHWLIPLLVAGSTLEIRWAVNGEI